ncbi:FkbM family methyltransferase [Aromatoleum diolicum]|uniref:FkbM family methyltransferase n=1 Tax=Aromatoleum diolicum TaxID=75796 RepID=A0ABX1QG31_9RHOO|nr:FkbM family methyltransferase [Aromatoleum diolicum]NMG77268.1 FkbM family methyltransferase [Aromatoleum diolicum]
MIVDIGAHDGTTGSNSRLLEQLGWRCLLVEPNPALAELVRRNRRSPLYECALSSAEGTADLTIVGGAPGADGLSGISLGQLNLHRITAEGYTTREIQVRTTRLDTLLEEAGVSPGIDVLSIDVEGHEHSVLAGFDIERWRPRLVIIEDNSDYADPRIPDWMRRRSYRRVFRSGVNDWYAAIDDATFDIAPNRAYIAWRTVTGPLRRRLRQGIDGALRPLRPWLSAHPALKRRIQRVKRWFGITRTF